MFVLRAAVGLIAIAASGCLIGFDPNRLTGGGETGSGGNQPAPAAGSMTGDMAGSGCDDLSPYMPGAPLSDWIEGRGSWRVVMMTQGKVLIQTTNSTGRDDRFVAWRQGRDVADATVSAVAILDGTTTDLNCLLARVTDATSYYALCVEDVGMRNRPQMRQWEINRVVGGVETRLVSAVIPTAASHALTFRVQGTTLTATVDGDTKPAISDSALTHGSVGVSTDEGGGFFNLCLGLQ